MSTAFSATLPLIEELKAKLKELDRATVEIAKAGASATQHGVAASEVRRAADRVVNSQEQLVTRLGQQQQQALGEQELLLRQHAQELTKATGEETARRLQGVQQNAAAAQQLIDQLLEAQPPLLAAISGQHEAGLTRQQQVLQQAAQDWSDSLHQQMQTELKLVRQATEVLQQNTQQQYDELSAINNQLQVATGRITAFSEVMNAARFATKLDTLETGQQQTLTNLKEVGQATSERFTFLQDTIRQSSSATATSLADFQRKSAEDVTSQHETLNRKLAQLAESQRQQQIAFQDALQLVQEQQIKQGKQSRLLQLLLLAAIAGVMAIQVLLRS